MNFIWCSDLHLKPASSYRKTLLAGDAFHALDQIEKYATENQADVILGGDVYDSNQPPGESVMRVRTFVQRIQASGHDVYYIEGNHDKVLKNPYLPDKFYKGHELLQAAGALQIPESGMLLGGVRISGIGHCPADKLLQKMQQLEECDVLCIHAGFRHLLSFEDAYDLTMADIPPQVKKAVLVGHVHLAQTTFTESGVAVHSSGSTWPWRVDEVDRKHCFIHFTGDLHHPSIIELDCRKWYDITEEQDITDTVEELKEDKHALAPVLRYVRDELPTLDHSKYPEVRLIATSGDKEVEELLDAQEEYAANLQEALPIGVPPDEYPLQYAFLKALLDSQDPKAFVRGHLQEQGVAFKEGA